MPITTALRRKIDRGPIAWAREFQVRPQVPGSTLFEPDGWPRFRVDGPTARSADGTARPWKTLKLALAYDPSEGGDDGALAPLGRAQTGEYFILDSELLTTKASLQVPHVVGMAKRWGLAEVLVDANQMPSLLRQAIEDEVRDQGVRLSVIEVRQTRNKENRLSALEAPASNGPLAVREDVPTHHQRLIEAFDPRRRDNRDDILDAIEMAYSDLTKTGARFHGRLLF